MKVDKRKLKDRLLIAKAKNMAKNGECGIIFWHEDPKKWEFVKFVRKDEKH